MALIAIIFFSSALFLLKNKIEKKAVSIYKQRSMLRVLEERNDNFWELKTTYNQVEKNLPVLKSALPDEWSVAEAAEYLERIAKSANSELVLNFESWDRAKSFNEMSKTLGFTATLNGNIATFSNFLSSFKNMPYFVEIENIEISNSSGVQNNNSRLTIRAKIYVKAKN